MAQSQQQPAASSSSSSTSAGGRTQAMRTAQQQPSSGSRTQTETANAQPPPQGPILTLTGAHDRSGPRVRWDEDVVDNEGMGKKSSKVCCIYHAPKAVDESSDESGSSSDSSSDESDSDAGEGGSARRADADRVGKGKGASRGRRKGGDVKKVRKPSPNAYEKIPKLKPKDGSAGSGGPV